MFTKQTFLALLAGTLAFNTLSAQQTAIDKVTEQTCNCMTQKDITEMEQAQFEQELGMCILTAASPFMTQLQEEENIDLSDPDAFQQIGNKVGAQIATSCPALFNKLMTFYGGAIETESEVRQLKVMEGTFVGIQPGKVTTIQLFDPNGTPADFLWLEAFEGGTALERNPDALKGKTMRVYYTSRLLYNAVTKNYWPQKVVERIEIR